MKAKNAVTCRHRQLKVFTKRRLHYIADYIPPHNFTGLVVDYSLMEVFYRRADSKTFYPPMPASV